MMKFVPVGVVAIGMLFLSGCSAFGTQGSRPSTSPTLTTGSGQELHGEGAILLSQFVEDHPGYFDRDLLPGSFMV